MDGRSKVRGYLLRKHRTNEAVGRRMDFSSDANANPEGLLEVNRGQHRTNEVVGRRMDFSSDANANPEGLLEVNRGQHRTNEAVGRRMDFSSDANANSEGLLEVNRGICMPQMAEKTEPDAPPNCAVVPEESACRRWRKRQRLTHRRIVRCCPRNLRAADGGKDSA